MVSSGGRGSEKRPYPEDPLQREKAQELVFKISRERKAKELRSLRFLERERLKKTHVIVPSFAVVVDDRRSEASRRIDTRAGDRNSREVDHDHRKPYRQRRQDLEKTKATP